MNGVISTKEQVWQRILCTKLISKSVQNFLEFSKVGIPLISRITTNFKSIENIGINKCFEVYIQIVSTLLSDPCNASDEILVSVWLKYHPETAAVGTIA